MAELTNFIYCINAERIPANGENGDSINAIGILTALTPEFVPGTFSFSIIFSILGMDTSENNVIRIIFAKKDEEKILVDSGPVAIPPMPDKDKVSLPPEYKGLNMSMDLRNVVFEEEGIYITRVFFNGDILREKTIYVKGRR